MLVGAKKPKSSAKSALGYVLRAKGRPERPKILAGDADAFRFAAEAVDKYASFVLAFSEPDPDSLPLNGIIVEFMEVLLPGLCEQVPYVAVLHKEKGKFHLHILVAAVAVTSGRRVSPYVHRIDLARVRAWTRYVNARYDLGDPDDPRRWRLVAPPDNGVSGPNREVHSKIARSLIAMAAAGVIGCRKDIEKVLIRGGWDVTRRLPRSLSIRAAGRKQPIRLSGPLFAADWRGRVKTNVLDCLASEFSSSREQRMRDAAKRLGELLKGRRLYNAKRFGGEAAAGSLEISVTEGPTQLREHVCERQKYRGEDSAKNPERIVDGLLQRLEEVHGVRAD